METKKRERTAEQERAIKVMCGQEWGYDPHPPGLPIDYWGLYQPGHCPYKDCEITVRHTH